MKEQTYAAARSRGAGGAGAPDALHVEARARAEGEIGSARSPTQRAIARMIDAAFWASLRREEGYRAEDLAGVSDAPEETVHPLLFERPSATRAGPLTRVAAGVERPRHAPGRVAYRRSELSVWGMVRAIPKYCCVIEVAEPGLLVIKHHRGEAQAKFVNVAVLQGDRSRSSTKMPRAFRTARRCSTSLLGFDSPAIVGRQASTCWCSLRCRCARIGAGRLLLVVPAGPRRVARVGRAADDLRGRPRRSTSWRCLGERDPPTAPVRGPGARS